MNNASLFVLFSALNTTVNMIQSTLFTVIGNYIWQNTNITEHMTLKMYMMNSIIK